MSEYKTFSNNEYPKVGEVCIVYRTNALDESKGLVGPTESFFGKFSIEDGIPYWGAGHKCKPIDQWKLVEFKASPKTQAEPPALDACNNQSDWKSWSQEIEEREKRIKVLEGEVAQQKQYINERDGYVKHLEKCIIAQVDQIGKLESMLKSDERKYKHALEVFAIKDAKITKLQIELQGLNARLNSNTEA